jgi:hypothetical protein
MARIAGRGPQKRRLDAKLAADDDPGMRKTICISLLLSALAWARPPSPTEILQGDQLKRAKIRWIRYEKGAPVTVEIFAGEAFRMNPDWSPQPVKLPYDLKRNTELEKALRAAHLGPPTKKPGPAKKKGERTLQLVVEGDKTWDVAAEWTRPAKSWKKLPGIYDQLEPLCDVLADIFQPVSKDAAKTGNLKSAPQ